VNRQAGSLPHVSRGFPDQDKGCASFRRNKLKVNAAARFAADKTELK